MTEYKKKAPDYEAYWHNPKELGFENRLASIILECQWTIDRINKGTAKFENIEITLMSVIHSVRCAWDLVPTNNDHEDDGA